MATAIWGPEPGVLSPGSEIRPKLRLIKGGLAEGLGQIIIEDEGLVLDEPKPRFANDPRNGRKIELRYAGRLSRVSSYMETSPSSDRETTHYLNDSETIWARRTTLYEDGRAISTTFVDLLRNTVDATFFQSDGDVVIHSCYEGPEGWVGSAPNIAFGAGSGQ